MGDKNFMAGLMGGLGQSLKEQQELTLKKEYQKSLIDINKLHGKLFEAQANAAALKAQGLPQSIIEAMNATEKDAGTIAQAANAPGPGAAGGQPQASVPQQMAGNMFAGGSGPIQIPGNPANNISVRQNNPFNLKDVGQAGSLGPGTRGFAVFPSPEVGVQAGIKQIQLDQSRGLPFAQFAEKYAPAYENPGWAQDVAKLIGLSDPNTPINQIPTMQLAQAVATRESQTRLPGGQQQVQPQQYQPMQPPAQGQQLITPNFPKTTGISSMKMGDRMALDVYFKQTYDLDTKFRETKGKFKAHGNPYDGFQITNEDTGQTIMFPPTMQKFVPQEITQPSGAVTQGWRLEALRTPIGGGLPPTPQGVFGGGAGGTQIKPPEFTWQETKSPTGAVNKIAVPKAQPGANYQAEPPGAKIGDAGRFNMIMQADNRIKEVNEMLMSGGNINRALIFKASAPGGGIGEGSQLYSKMYQVVDSALRLETGAQANASEIDVKMKEYWPSFKDTDATIRQKLKDLNEYANGAVELADPTGEIRKMRQPQMTPETTRGTQISPSGQPTKAPKSASDYLKMRGLQ